MDIKTFEALKYLNLSEGKIPSYTQEIQQFIEKIFQSDNIMDLVALKPAVNTLHSFRARFPKMETQINTALFDLQGKSLSARLPAIKQNFAVSFLTGFEKHPASDIQSTKKLIFAMSNQDNLKQLMPMAQRMTSDISESYNKKFKRADKDMSLARLLRDFVSYCYWLNPKKGVMDANWAHYITHALAQAYPIEEFQTVAQNFPKKTRAPIGNTVKLPEGAVRVYSFFSEQSINRISRIYDQ